MNLSRHFTLEELTSSEYAIRHGIDNTPGPEELENLKILASGLERVRAVAAAPIIVTSGLRVPKVNAGVGGSKTSDHVKGLAADIKCPTISPEVLARLISQAKDEVKYKQCILEFGQWVHISFPDVDEPAKLEDLTAVKIAGKTEYRKGIA